jgi:holo-[acyl-carrier protein] synthase
MVTSPTAVGIDITEVARIERILDKYGDRFIAYILGDDERKLLSERADRAQFVAGRFAAKEAAVKALGRYLTTRPAFGAMQVVPGVDGRPNLRFASTIKELPGSLSALVSISHEREYATAIVILSETK